MAFVQVPAALLTNEDVRPPHIATYAAMFFRLDRYSPPFTGSASVAQLARAAGIADVKTARRSVAWLERHGFVRVTDRKGGRVGLRYELHPEGCRFSVPQPTPKAVAQAEGTTAPQGGPHAVAHPYRDPVPTGEPYRGENPPEGWRGFAALLEGQGLDVAGAGPAMVAAVERLTGRGWKPSQLFAATWDVGGLVLIDATSPLGLLGKRLDGLRSRPAPAERRQRRQADEDLQAVGRLMERARRDAEKELRDVTWQEADDQERAELEAAARAQAQPHDPALVVRELAKTLLMQRRGLNGAQIDQLAAERLAARQGGTP